MITLILVTDSDKPYKWVLIYNLFCSQLHSFAGLDYSWDENSEFKLFNIGKSYSIERVYNTLNYGKRFCGK